jgi:hypothetical protein
MTDNIRRMETVKTNLVIITALANEQSRNGN